MGDESENGAVGLESTCGEARPGDRAELFAWIGERLGVWVPTRALVEGHAAPFEYLCHAFFDGREGEGSELGVDPRAHAGGSDSVVWANRGGGKTFLAAVATLLDMVFKPGIEIRVLGGSLEQSKHLHRHLVMLLEDSGLSAWVEGKVTERRVVLKNRSRVELLAQSQTSVRGTRVQKLRCDEVELFDPGVWEAAQLVTRGKDCGGVWVPGTIECLSTMHVPYGLMWRLVRECDGEEGAEGQRHGGTKGGRGSGRRRLFKWGVVDVLERCPDERSCDGCVLFEECRGRAKERVAAGVDGEEGSRALPQLDGGAGPGGHVPVEDAASQKARVSEQTWVSEMLCDRPRRSDCVLPEFDRAAHVFGGAIGDVKGTPVAGMDFGIRAPTVILWGVVDESGVLRIVREREVAGEALPSHIAAIKTSVPLPAWVGVDPAGLNRSDQTGVSCVQVMQKAGLVVKFRRMAVLAGLDLIRRRLRPASGGPSLLVHESCARLIECLEQYRYPADRPESLEPVKDGSDHAVDALRYLVQNLDAGYVTTRGRYV